jgi:hypothetical protein
VASPLTRPTFLVIGAMKAGTTTLWEQLRAQPQVFMADEKEVDFFVEEKEWSRGVAWYEEQFASAPPSAVAIGEASTNYAKHPLFDGVPARAVSVLPDVKIVYLVRHPIERMRSHWMHARSAGWESRTFSRAVTVDPQYIDVSRYAHQLEQWLEHVPRDRVLIETAERMHDDPATSMRTILSFLGADPQAAVDTKHHANAAAARDPLRRPIAQAVKRVPGVPRLARFLPGGVRRAYGRATTVPVHASGATSLPPAQEAAIVERLRPDLVRLKAIMGEPFDAWGLA